MFIGLIATIPIPETKNRSLEEIADDYVEIKRAKWTINIFSIYNTHMFLLLIAN